MFVDRMQGQYNLKQGFSMALIEKMAFEPRLEGERLCRYLGKILQGTL